MTVGQLDVNFRRFYAEARNKAGEPYSKSTLLGFRHSFERYLNRPPFNQGLNLSSDPRFKRSNEMLNAQIVHLKRQGKENVKHKPAIEDEDLKKLKTSQGIALTSPLTLLQNVWFHVVLFFCRRGREGQRQLKRSSSNLKLMPLEEVRHNLFFFAPNDSYSIQSTIDKNQTSLARPTVVIQPFIP